MEKEIIKFMKQNECMYDVNSSDYSNMKIRETKWGELASELQVTVDEVKKKWKTLQNGFHREDRRVTSGSVAPNAAKWKYYEDLTFLQQNKKRRSTFSNVAKMSDEKLNDEYFVNVKMCEAEKRIIEFMKENDFMHNMHCEEYKNFKAKDLKWRELANELGATVNEIKKRWKTLRDCFHREDQRINSSSGSSDGNVSKWKYYEDLIFLRYSKKRKSHLACNSDEELFEEYFENLKKTEIEKKIIDFMRENNFMHNIHSVDYKNLKSKERKWAELAIELELSVDEVKKKWKTLKNGFYREDMRISVLSADSEFSNVTKWKYYDDLMFLRRSKRLRCDIKLDLNSSDEESFPDEVCDNWDLVHMEPKIIQFAKENEFIHNINSPKYKCIKEKSMKWEAFANDIGVPVKAVKRKWKTLKDGFYREDRKVNMFCETSTPIVSKWRYFEDLTFLRDSKKKDNIDVSSAVSDLFNEIIDEVTDFENDTGDGEIDNFVKSLI